MARAKTTKRKPKLPKPRKYWQQQIDKFWFSRYIKLMNKDFDGNGRCVTCGKVMSIKGLDAGHYIPREFHSRYDLKNVHLQCKGCNNFQKGHLLQYRKYILKRYGDAKNVQLELIWEHKRYYHKYPIQTMRKFAIWLQKECIKMNYTDYWKPEPLLENVK